MLVTEQQQGATSPSGNGLDGTASSASSSPSTRRNAHPSPSSGRHERGTSTRHLRAMEQLLASKRRAARRLASASSIAQLCRGAADPGTWAIAQREQDEEEGSVWIPSVDQGTNQASLGQDSPLFAPNPLSQMLPIAFFFSFAKSPFGDYPNHSRHPEPYGAVNHVISVCPITL
ncbi:uncharacterized protein TRIVIDRAFT_61640 [Trichoderma virens Gv29-8]|uniref:Uncharacterized protein n=1 Tax=Hypocrea virens (strain Gv29-8 / FGSC 10586) TaxID=413071 RepID=G9MKZ0_HYPVG|nr:uncharacterized protein TRIVIDRAFT_61640 [Trichoderma virens Gv29-8]EHK24884.1 hypothetical protein TRIVIDRAFT_61640 [Trichoderma virens Gv29-8]